ncbi:hypothetical protein SAMN06272735_4123 [Streptomyces sp. TLI_55]|nr:hypothetical protein SAMN06272735_4123 [Streptomyces sp. TLI_55]
MVQVALKKGGDLHRSPPFVALRQLLAFCVRS